MKKVLIVFGTRPEAIKLFPVIEALNEKKIDVYVCNTGQQKHLAKQMVDELNISVDFDLKIMKSNQSLAELSSNLIKKIDALLASFFPDLILTHGDTTTCFCASTVAFYNNIPIGHVEAGLRTKDVKTPFPEEFNRRAVSLFADLHFSPTKIAKENLIAQGISSKNVFITGNTVIDAVLASAKKLKSGEILSDLDTILRDNSIDSQKKIILVTGHRRENFGESFKNIFLSLKRIAKNLDVEIIYPVHLNPGVKKDAEELLRGVPNINLIEPIEYHTFIDLMTSSYLILTDSGGIQEEAPSFNIPVLILREETERPEGLLAGTSILVGSDKNRIYNEVKRLFDDEDYYKSISNAKNPYGNGKASQKIANIIDNYLNK